MKSWARSRVKFFTCLGIPLGLGVLFVLVIAGLLGNNLFYRHRRAYQLWQSRQPGHFSYQVTITKLMISRTWHVEVRQGRMVRMIEARAGETSGMESWIQATSFSPLSFSGGVDLVEATFAAIQKALIPPRSLGEFMARANPMFYQNFVQQILPGGWENCRPAFPQVRYHAVYGFPEEATLAGLPCVASLDLGSSITVQIENFQVLP